MIRALSAFYGSRFLQIELLIAVLAWLVFMYWALQRGGEDLLVMILRNNRADIYGTVASICGSLFGFCITAVSVVMIASGSERLKVVRESRHYEDLWRVFVSPPVPKLGLFEIDQKSAA